jgi:predicted amidohydrolase YtcJ
LIWHEIIRIINKLKKYKSGMGQKTILVIIPLILSIGIIPVISFAENIDSPRKQMANGFASEDVVCKTGFLLMIRYSGTAACVGSLTADNLEERGWGTISIQTLTADKIFYNGKIITINPTNDIVEAVAINGDKIFKVGSQDEVFQLKDTDTKLFDLQGKTMLPGFIDSHSHITLLAYNYAFGVDLNSPPVGGVNSIDEIISKLQEKAETTPQGDLIFGWGYDDTLLSEKRHPTRFDLDTISTEHPIFLLHVSSHLGSVNSMMLEMLNIDKDTPDPAGGIIQKNEETGEPNGVMEESAMLPFLLKTLESFSFDEKIDAIADAALIYAANGITTAQDGATTENEIKALLEASQRSKLAIRIVSYPLFHTTQEIDDGRFNPDFESSKMVSKGATKIIADGAPQGKTAYLTEPYLIPIKGDPDYRGYPNMPREELVSLVTNLHEKGHQLAIHANGDAAIDDVIFALSEAQKEFPRDDARHIIMHSQIMREDQLDSIKNTSIIPSFFPLHTYYWGDVHINNLGKERAFHISPTKSALDRNIIFTIHHDAPVVPPDQLKLMWSAIHRVSTSDQIIGEEQRILPIDALRAVTINAAYQYNQEDIKGSIEPGKLADLVILSDNPLENPETIDQIQVLETIVGGKTVFIMN